MTLNIDTDRHHIITDNTVPLRVGGQGGVDYIVGNQAALRVRNVRAVSPTLSGASYTFSNLIPAGAIVYAVRGKVLTTVTGASATDVGVSGDLNRFRTDLPNTVNSRFVSTTDGNATHTGPLFYKTATGVILTAKTSNFTGGVIEVEVIFATVPLTE